MIRGLAKRWRSGLPFAGVTEFDWFPSLADHVNQRRGYARHLLRQSYVWCGPMIHMLCTPLSRWLRFALDYSHRVRLSFIYHQRNPSPAFSFTKQDFLIKGAYPVKTLDATYLPS